MFWLCLLQLFGSRRTEENRPTCWLSVKVFGNELSVFTCEDLYSQIDQLSLSMAGLAVKLLKVYWREIVLTVSGLFSGSLPICLPSSSCSRVRRFSWTTEPCWWQTSWFYRHCLVCPSNWASTRPSSCRCVWRAMSTTGTLLTSPWLDTSNQSISIWTHVTGATTLISGSKLCPSVECNRCLYSQCLCGAVCHDGGWRCFGSSCSGLGLWAQELHQSGRQHSAAGRTGCQGDT